MFHVLAHTSSALGEVTGGFQAALDNSFYELCTFHFKDEEAEAQKYKLFGKRGILPWALAIKPRDSATGWDLERIWTSAPPPAT